MTRISGLTTKVNPHIIKYQSPPKSPFPMKEEQSNVVNEEAQIMLKEAFKRFLKEQLGVIEDKPPVELKAWNLALLELAIELSLEDEASNSNEDCDRP